MLWETMGCKPIPCLYYHVSFPRKDSTVRPANVQWHSGSRRSAKQPARHIINCRLLANTWPVSSCGALLITVPFRLMKIVWGKDVMPYLEPTDPSASSTIGYVML